MEVAHQPVMWKWLLLLSLALLGGVAGAGQRQARPVQIEMKNVRLHVDEGIVLDIRILRGEMTSRGSSAPLFDDQRSFVLHVASGEVAMDTTSLGNLMNRHIFAYDGAPLKDITIRPAQDQQIEQRGTLKRGISVPFSVRASVSATADGRLQLHAESVKAIGVPAKGLMNLFGLELDDVVDLKDRRGIAVTDNDIIITPGQVLPPPEIRGHLLRAEMRNGRLYQTFAPAAGRPPRRLSPPDPRAPNYIYFSDNDITFGKLTMSGADLQLIDQDPKDPFDFFPQKYNVQLVAGYSKNTPQKGLKTYMPDYDDLRNDLSRK